MDMYAELDKAMGYEPEYKSWGSIETGMASCNWEETGKPQERHDSLGDDPDDPRVDQRVDPNGYQRWRRRQQVRLLERGCIDEGGFAEHTLCLSQ